MKKTKQKLRKGTFLVILSSLGFCNFAQLPEEYITKVSYHEKKEVIYSLPTKAELSC